MKQELPDAELLRLREVLAGRYSIEGELGRGGMGIVYLAREVSLDRSVALKLLPPSLAAQPAARERFLHEARIAAKLSHPNIVPIHAVDEVDDFVFFAMAYIEGETLGQRIREKGPRPPSEAARILREVAWALAYAHSQGVVHRDVKPDNILIEASSGRALVTDFGIASVAETSASEGAGRISGTAEFMSPEQAAGQAVGPASDTYSLGVVGYYALSGEFPFEGSTVAATLAKHMSEPPPSIAAAAPGIPTRLAQTIDRCLAKDPDLRHTDEQELAESLGQALGERRELPVALRVYVRQRERIGVGGVFLYLVVLTIPASIFGGIAGGELGALIAAGIYAGGVTIVPAGLFLHRARVLQKSGFTREELIQALRTEGEQSREEGAFAFGRRASLYERFVRGLAALGFGISGLSLLAIPLTNLPTETLVGIAGVSAYLASGSSVLALYRLQRRRDIWTELRGRFWRTRLGRWVFKFAGLGLKRRPALGSATYRATEFAIGLEADRLFEQLPKAMRRQLGDLPDVVRKLEVDAQRMRRRIEELDVAIGEVRLDRPASASVRAAPDAGLETDMKNRLRALEGDLLESRDQTQQRLADAVAALETIRLGLIRMQAGAGSVESMTGDLASAREIAEEVDRLLEAHDEVRGLIGDTG